MKPSLRFRTRSVTPGRALSDSAAPPMTMTIDRPGPEDKIASHDFRDTEAMPRDKIKSRYNGNRKLLDIN